MSPLSKLSAFALLALCSCSRTTLLFCDATVACPKHMVCVAQRCIPGEDPNACTTPGTVRCGEASIDLLTSHANCGACNRPCAAAEVCEAGECAGMCSAGLTDCMGSCVDLLTSPQNCGACNRAC